MVHPHPNQFLSSWRYPFMASTCSWNLYSKICTQNKRHSPFSHIPYSSSCLAITRLGLARHPCRSPMDSWASGAWRGAGGRSQWERGGRSQCRQGRRTRSSSIRSRLCPRSRSCVWLTDASPPERWKHRDLREGERCVNMSVTKKAKWGFVHCKKCWREIVVELTC